jgi:flagellar basal-body rod modification protein FlgD
MTRISNLGANSAGAAASGVQHDAFAELDLKVFLDLMITELQNQDPLNPLDNTELLSQISQMREIGATDQLTKTLDGVLLGQSIASATNLIGADVTALSDNGERIEGQVARIAIADGEPKLHVERKSVVAPTNSPGDLAPGEYKYKVVWEDSRGTQFAVELETEVPPGGEHTSALLTFLPETDTQKRVYRTKNGSDGPYYLVDTILDGKTGSYLDTTADADLSGRVLDGQQQILNGLRKYEVSMKNVAEIRPPELLGL